MFGTKARSPCTAPEGDWPQWSAGEPEHYLSKAAANGHHLLLVVP